MPDMLHIATIGKPHGVKGAMSVQSKTRPQAIIFNDSLFFEDGTIFEVSNFETHHTKVVCFSPNVPDRSHAEKMRFTKLYCNKARFFTQNPEQIFDDLCSSYQVLDSDKTLIGQLDYVDLLNHIPFLIISQKEKTLHLPVDIQDIDHETHSITLSYQPDLTADTN